MFPLHEKMPGAKPPDGTHYVLARNGFFLRQKQWWVDATIHLKRRAVPCTHLSSLSRRKELLRETVSATLLLPQLPAHILGSSLKLAKAVCDETESEVCLLLCYDATAGYELIVPAQEVTPGGIRYEPPRSTPLRRVGSIHSHGLLGAYHSGTDEEDERVGNDGVHVTLGSLGLYPRFSLSAEIVVNAHRFPVDPSWFIGLRPAGGLWLLECPGLEDWRVPASWMDAIVQLNAVKRSGAP